MFIAGQHPISLLIHGSLAKTAKRKKVKKKKVSWRTGLIYSHNELDVHM